MSVMHPRPIVLVVLILAGMGICAPLRAQTLADVAKKEEERRKSVKTSAKVYTNKDLSAPPGGASPASAASAGDQSIADAARRAASGDAAAPEKDKANGPAKDQAYWSGRRKALQEKLDHDQGYTVALQTRINSLATDVINRDDPAQRRLLEMERVKALADLARLQQDIVNGKKALADFEEEARRAGVPAGWLR